MKISKIYIVLILTLIHLSFPSKAQVFQNDTLSFCRQDSVLLDAGPNYSSYLWNTGQTTPSIYAKYSGLFQVIATSPDSSFVRDSVYVSLGQAYLGFHDTIACYNSEIQLFVDKVEPSCLVGYYPLTELEGGLLRDYSGCEFDISFLNTVNFMNGRMEDSKAVHLEANTLYFYSKTENYFSNSFTLHFWLCPDSAYGTAAGTDSTFFIINHWTPFNESDLSHNSFAVTINNHGILSFLTSNGVSSNSFSIDTANYIPPKQWTMVDIVCSMNRLSIFVNANEILNDTITVFPQSFVGTTYDIYYIGSTPAPSYNHNYSGGLADLRIYTCDLTRYELYNLLEDNTTYEYEYDWRNQSVGNLDLHTRSINITTTDSIGEYYFVDVSNEVGVWPEYPCNDSVFVKSHPELFIDLVQVKTGCPESTDGSFIADIYGGVPFSDTSYINKAYKITWPRGYPHVDSIGWVSRLPKGTYTVTVEDSVGCLFSQTIDIETYPEINDSINIEPNILYRQKPVIKFTVSYNTECFIEEYFWDFGDGTQSREPEVEHSYGIIPDDVTSYVVTSVLTDEYGCVDSTTITLEVKEAKLDIPNVFTPNGDGINDDFKITISDDEQRLLSEVFDSNTLSIYNRQGKLVYQKDNYESGEFDGGNLSDGVYYYVLLCRGHVKKETYSGYVHIFTRNNQ